MPGRVEGYVLVDASLLDPLVYCRTEFRTTEQVFPDPAVVPHRRGELGEGVLRERDVDEPAVLVHPRLHLPAVSVLSYPIPLQGLNVREPQTREAGEEESPLHDVTAAWSIDVVKGVTLNTDGKGHVLFA